MYFIPQHTFKNLPILFKTDLLYKGVTAVHLPQAYLDLLAEQNGGYLLCSRIPTKEPTSDGLDYAAVHEILGLHDNRPNSLYAQQAVIRSAGLPDYFVLFSINGSQLFAFDYSKLSLSGEPSIRYIDIETDNWQTVAADFDQFLQLLNPAPIAVPEEIRLTHTEGAHAFLLADAAGLPELFLHFEDDPDKQWYLQWIAYFSDHPDPAFIDSHRETARRTNAELFVGEGADHFAHLSNPAVWVGLVHRTVDLARRSHPEVFA